MYTLYIYIYRERERLVALTAAPRKAAGLAGRLKS